MKKIRVNTSVFCKLSVLGSNRVKLASMNIFTNDLGTNVRVFEIKVKLFVVIKAGKSGI